MLIALVIVAVLAQTVLKQYGLLPGTAAQRSGVPGEAADGLGIGAAPLDTAGSMPVPANALERARGVEAYVEQQARDRDKRIDKQLE